jgi:hypothetical protein
MCGDDNSGMNDVENEDDVEADGSVGAGMEAVHRVGKDDAASPRELLQHHPLKTFLRLQKWKAADLAAACNRDRAAIMSFIRQLSNFNYCFDCVNCRLTNCQCLSAIDRCYYDSVADILGEFFSFLYFL